jgi:hypothetical protein
MTESFTLDRDRLTFIISLLEKAKRFGFSSRSSPIDILLETFVDLCLLLRDSFKEGAPERAKNVGLKFLETQQDVLGNPKQIKVFTPSKWYWSPEASKIFESLASFGVLVKKQKPIKDSFMESFKGSSLITPPVQKPKQTTKQKNIARRAKKAQTAYFRRRQRRTDNLN